MYGQKYCVICGVDRQTNLPHKEDCQWYLKPAMPLTEGGTKSQIKSLSHLTKTPISPSPTRPQRHEPHPNIVQTKNEEIVADIRNKLSSAYSFIQMAYEDVISMEVRETQRKQALINFNYLIERLKEIK
jgi:transcription antitermination factor NusG